MGGVSYGNTVEVTRDFSNDFIPIVDLDLNQTRPGNRYQRDYSGFQIKEGTSTTQLNNNLDSSKLNQKLHTIEMLQDEVVVRFEVQQANSKATDNDGFIEIKPHGVNVSTASKVKVEYGQAIALRISSSSIQPDAYIDFYAHDDGDGWWDEMGLSNIHCGRVAVKAKQFYRLNPSSPNAGQFSQALNSLYKKREQWGAKQPLLTARRSFEPYILLEKSDTQQQQDNKALPVLTSSLFGIAIHHSGNSGMEAMNAVQNEHMNKDERADIGYHFGIGLNGEIFEGRYVGVKGSHLDMYNTGIIGIVFLADFDHDYTWDIDGESDMTSAAYTSLFILIRALIEQFPSINVLGGHKEWKNNRARRCPGEYGLSYVRAARTRLNLKSPEEAGHG